MVQHSPVTRCRVVTCSTVGTCPALGPCGQQQQPGSRHRHLNTDITLSHYITFFSWWGLTQYCEDPGPGPSTMWSGRRQRLKIWRYTSPELARCQVPSIPTVHISIIFTKYNISPVGIEVTYLHFMYQSPARSNHPTFSADWLSTSQPRIWAEQRGATLATGVPPTSYILYLVH